MTALKIRKIGGSLALILPKEFTNELNVASGDTLFVDKLEVGYRLTAANPNFVRQMAIAREGMRKYRNALQELAK